MKSRTSLILLTVALLACSVSATIRTSHREGHLRHKAQSKLPVQGVALNPTKVEHYYARVANETTSLITACNQQYYDEGEMMTNINDVCERVPGVFYLNMYTASVFGENQPGNLTASVDFANAKAPSLAPGTPRCFTIDAEKEDKVIAFCSSSDGQYQNMVQSWRNVVKCRNGEDLKPISIQEEEAEEEEELPSVSSVFGNQADFSA